VRRLVVLIAVLLLPLLLGSCAMTHQIERGNLSTRKMQLEPEPEMQGTADEFHSIREGASGGTGQNAGGGCGCN